MNYTLSEFEEFISEDDLATEVQVLDEANKEYDYMVKVNDNEFVSIEKRLNWLKSQKSNFDSSNNVSSTKKFDKFFIGLNKRGFGKEGIYTYRNARDGYNLYCKIFTKENLMSKLVKETGILENE